MIQVTQPPMPRYGRVAYLLLRLLALLVFLVHVRYGLHNSIRLLFQMRQVQIIVDLMDNINARGKIRIVLVGEAHAAALWWEAVHLRGFVGAVEVLAEVAVQRHARCF